MIFTIAFHHSFELLTIAFCVKGCRGRWKSNFTTFPALWFFHFTTCFFCVKGSSALATITSGVSSNRVQKPWWNENRGHEVILEGSVEGVPFESKHLCVDEKCWKNMKEPFACAFGKKQTAHEILTRLGWTTLKDWWRFEPIEQEDRRRGKGVTCIRAAKVRLAETIDGIKPSSLGNGKTGNHAGVQPSNLIL